MRTKLGVRLVVLCLLGLTAGPTLAHGAGDARGVRSTAARSRKRWIASWIALAAANALDVSSSRAHGEANPLLRNPAGDFAVGRAVAVKSAIAGGFLATQWWVVRQHPEKNYYRPFTVANAAAAGALAGVAARNFSLPSR